MPRPRIDLHQTIRELLSHTRPTSSDDTPPIDQYEERLAECGGLLKYLDRRLTAAKYYDTVYERHMLLQRRMILVTLIEGFERFLKDLAILCVNHLAGVTYDDRFDLFKASGTELALHFSSGDVGKAMCESDTWISNEDTSKRFRSILRSPLGDVWSEFLFPAKPGQNPTEYKNAQSLAILWQIRHSITHNSGLLTKADTARFRLLAKQPIESSGELAPTVDDLRYVTRFLRELAATTNARIGERLAVVLSEVHQGDSSLFEPQKLADALSKEFTVRLTIAGLTGTL